MADARPLGSSLEVGLQWAPLPDCVVPAPPGGRCWGLFLTLRGDGRVHALEVYRDESGRDEPEPIARASGGTVLFEGKFWWAGAGSEIRVVRGPDTIVVRRQDTDSQSGIGPWTDAARVKILHAAAIVTIDSPAP